MTAHEILERLEKVRSIGTDRWLACCPAHDDKHPSLSIKVGATGAGLVHCWAGCSTDAVLGALGMEMADLFPGRKLPASVQRRNRFNTSDALQGIAFEATLVALMAKNVADGKVPTQAEKDRLFIAAGRINAAVAEVGLD